MNRTMLELPDDTRKRYEELAQHTGQQPEDVMAEVLQAYLDQVAEEDRRLAESIAQADRGETFDAEEIHAEDAARLTQLGVTPEQMAAIRAEVRAEAEAFYGVPLCD